ncbi:MAG: calcium/proton exchanger [Phycisphaerales bacterium]|jgi:Ca2+:H+ antiporter|nr:calcium/proton exchanger [Phycisphaerales bacterium]
MRYLKFGTYLAIPLAFVCHFLLRQHEWEPMATFALAGIGVIPLAGLMGVATEHLSERTGPTWGGLLNATFGNAAELIIAIIALTKGLNGIVKASLTGSILGNLLLVAGASMLVGGWKREKQTFNRLSGETSAGLLMLAVAGMLFPAIFHFTAKQMNDSQLIVHEHSVSLWTSILLLIVYALGLLFTLKTHAHIFSRRPAENPEDHAGVSEIHGHWSVGRSVGMLLLASAGIGIVAELLVGSAEQMAHQLGWNEIFVGVILLAIIGNAAEHSTAILLARRNDMDTALTITNQSSLQIALFAVPILVLLSTLMVNLGWQPGEPMDLIFSPMEVVAVLLCVGIVVVLGVDGQTNWFEGVLLLGVYGILAIAFFNIPTGNGGHDQPPLEQPPASLATQ